MGTVVRESARDYVTRVVEDAGAKGLAFEDLLEFLARDQAAISQAALIDEVWDQIQLGKLEVTADRRIRAA
jgi:hypothetical protein